MLPSGRGSKWGWGGRKGLREFSRNHTGFVSSLYCACRKKRNHIVETISFHCAEFSFLSAHWLYAQPSIIYILNLLRILASS